ncbi:G-type lectin S-receptor-like serine/threonine-protein kinase At2g19130 [Musa acuminata AAA Group]|uniref:G-type lectin S-receptor-like serine/threonine-protein kinase At2g19130 n=1 Tax=Musa acuminata AAA Group TaxID=214697 RepID=UPI0031D865A2
MSARRRDMARLIALCMSVFFLLLTFSARTGVADESLFRGQSLSGGQTMVSGGGKFELGFFAPGNSSKYYIGIWYKVSKKTVVWVANREKPVASASSSELTLAEDGSLVLRLKDSKNQIWSSNSSSPLASNSTVAVLLDDGNLVLKDNVSSDTLWQSFDHPTNTWLPGAKLGYNKSTGRDRFLTSWRNPEDPSPGMFTLEIDPNGVDQFYLLRDRRHRYWTTGVWTGEIFTAIPEMRSNYFFNFSHVSNMIVNEFSFYVRDSAAIHNFMLDFTGEMKRQKWDAEAKVMLQFCSLPRDPCDVEGRCGPFGSCNNFSSAPCHCLQGFNPRSSNEWTLGDHTGGCVRRTPLRCGDRDGFLVLPSTQPPANPVRMSTVGGREECRIACLRNCSCTAYAFHSNCSIWQGDLVNLKYLGSSNGAKSGAIYLRVDASELADTTDHKKRENTAMIVVGAVSGVAAIAVVVLLLALRYRKGATVGASGGVQGPLIAFDYKLIKKATKGFTEKLGRGSFGSVFKGEMPDSGAIAVKRLESMRQGEKQFRMEVSTIGTIHHVNLVRLRGFCCEGDKRLLVYDYMPMGSLDSVLFADGREALDWKKRYGIALGIARGLAYLHEKCRECIMHCDIKPENILLDMDMCPKIADFGMAKLLGREFSRVLTTVRGTFGYLAPEWITGSAITPKADVYSFGLMLHEIVSGRRNTARCEEWNRHYFPLWAAIKLQEGDTLCLLDPKLKGKVDEEELSRVCRIACWCIQDLECSRPSMGEVVQQLEGVLDVSIPPIPVLLQKLLDDDASAGDNYFSTI